ncbi:MAG: dTMP kinase [Moorea sp. SIO1F2]|uniref:dTMP kinase n=1 Tax=Moorena sp. SIO1F2 TaxID=2607819 RepID=UPI0013B99665|nr:dTMP kinase [Moorena sp. SIO1F2]NET83103.1 dTMP kinase [Moorena sp. SIO1F2]
MSGKLIVFEGVEGGGKTTQLQRCSNWLRASGLQDCLGTLDQTMPVVVVTREPGGTLLGTKVRQLLLDRDSSPIHPRAELLLYAADRAEHVEELIKPQLVNGAIILCDRYTDSTIAYQGYGRGIDLKLIEELNQIATGGLESDLTLWLDIDVEIGLERARQRGTVDRMEQADLAFHRRVQQGFQELYQQNPDRIVRVDASYSEEEVHNSIQKILRERFKSWFQERSTLS